MPGFKAVSGQQTAVSSQPSAVRTAGPRLVGRHVGSIVLSAESDVNGREGNTSAIVTSKANIVSF